MKLWEEKIGVGEKFAGNAATVWGTKQEPVAAARYQEITGHPVESMSFKLYGDSLVTSWLGASPDGLIPATSLDTAGMKGPPPCCPTYALTAALGACAVIKPCSMVNACGLAEGIIFKAPEDRSSISKNEP